MPTSTIGQNELVNPTYLMLESLEHPSDMMSNIREGKRKHQISQGCIWSEPKLVQRLTLKLIKF